MHIVVVGGGYWGSKHVRVLAGLEEVSTVTLVETDGSRREALSSAFPSIRTAPDLDGVEGEAHGMVVATHPTSHHSLGLAAIERGWGALIEKPLASSVDDAHELCRLADEAGVSLMTGHTFVFNPVVRALRQRIVDGELGDIRLLRSSRLNLGLYQSDVNVIWDLAPHDISIMNYLLDAKPTRVTAWGACLAHGVHEDVSMMRVEYGALGVEAYINLSWLEPSKVREVTVVGSERMAVYDDTNADERLRIYDRGVEAEPDGLMHEAPMSYRYGDITSPHIPFAEPLMLEDRAFVESLRTGKSEIATGWDGLSVVATIEAAQLSIAEERPVAIAEVLPIDLTQVSNPSQPALEVSP